MIIRRFEDQVDGTCGIVIAHDNKEYTLFYERGVQSALTDMSWVEYDMYVPENWETSYALQEIWEDIKEEVFEELNLRKGHSFGILPGALYIDHQELDLIDGILIIKTYKAFNV